MPFSMLLSLYLNKANTLRGQKLICSLFLAHEKINSNILTAFDIFHLQSLETGWGNGRKDSF